MEQGKDIFEKVKEYAEEHQGSDPTGLLGKVEGLFGKRDSSPNIDSDQDDSASQDSSDDKEENESSVEDEPDAADDHEENVEPDAASDEGEEEEEEPN